MSPLRVEDSVQLTSPTSSTGTHDTWRSRSTFRMSIRSCLGPDLNLCAEAGEANCRQFAGHRQRELQSPWGRRVFGTPQTLRQAETKATNVSMYRLENKIMIPEARRNAANLSQARRTPLSSSNALVLLPLRPRASHHHATQYTGGNSHTTRNCKSIHALLGHLILDKTL